MKQMSTTALILVQGAAITISEGRERAAWAVEAVRVGVLGTAKANLNRKRCQETRSLDSGKGRPLGFDYTESAT